MAEKINLFELDIDTDAAVRDVIALKENIEILKAQTKKAKEEQGEFSAEYVKYSAALKSAQGEVRTQENLIKNATSANVAAAGSIDQLRKQLSVVSAQWAQLSKEERENTEEGQRLTKQKKELTEALKGEERATGDARRNVGNYKDALGSSVPAMGKAQTAIKGVGMAFKVMLGPLGLVIAAVVAITTYFQRSEEGQNKWTKAIAIAEVVLNNFLDVVSMIGEFLVDAFTKPQETLDKFKGWIDSVGEFFKNTFGNIIGGAIEMFVANLQRNFAMIGLAWQKLKGVFTDNAEGITEAQENVKQKTEELKAASEKVKEGYENLKEAGVDAYNAVKGALQEFNAEMQREIEMTIYLENLKADLAKLNRKYMVEDAKAQREINELREIAAQKDKFDAETRAKAGQRAIDLQNQMMDRELHMAKQRLMIHQEEMKMSESKIEDYDKLAELEVALINVETKNSQARRRLISEQLNAQREAAAEEAKIALAEMEEELALEEERLTKERENTEKILAAADQARADQLEAARMDYENKLELARNNQFAMLDLEREGLEAQRQMELEFAESIGADKALIEQKYAEYEKEIEREKQEAKIALAAGFASNIAQIFGEATAVGKAAAIAETTFSTFSAAQKAFSSLASIPVVGPALGAAAAGAAIAGGVARVKKIASTKSGLPGDKSGGGGIAGGGSSGGGMPTSVAPSVGQGLASRDSAANQASTIKQGFSEALRENPLQPTLVLDNVTANQSAETQRNETSVL